METWIKNQCNFHSYRSQSFKISLTLRTLFTGGKSTRSELDPFIQSADNVKHRVLVEGEMVPSGDREKREGKLWRRLSLRSFRKRREKKQEDKSRPMIPEVLRTYDQQKREHNKNLEWL